jgi:hypothetical protein
MTPINDKDQINKGLCKELSVKWNTGLCPHCGHYCSNNTVFCNPPLPLPDFFSKTGRIDLLELMKKREDWGKFLDEIDSYNHWSVYMTDPNGKLARACLDWLRKERGNE